MNSPGPSPRLPSDGSSLPSGESRRTDQFCVSKRKTVPSAPTATSPIAPRGNESVSSEMDHSKGGGFSA